MNWNLYSTVSNVYYDWCHEDQNGETQKTSLLMMIFLKKTDIFNYFPDISISTVILSSEQFVYWKGETRI